MYEPTPEELSSIRRAFTYHAPTMSQIPRYQEIRDMGYAMASALMRLCPPSRERSLALTNLEQVAFWANAGIARNEAPKPPADDQVKP